MYILQASITLGWSSQDPEEVLRVFGGLQPAANMTMDAAELPTSIQSAEADATRAAAKTDGMMSFIVVDPLLIVVDLMF